MKWHSAILLTCGLLAASIVMMTFTSNEVALPIIVLSVTVSAIWIAADSGSFGWGLVVLALWPLFFPWYLIEKEVMKRREGRHLDALNLHKSD